MGNRFQSMHNALEHFYSDAYQTRWIMGTERAIDETPKSKGFRILKRGTLQERKVGSDACFALGVHACIHTHAILT